MELEKAKTIASEIIRRLAPYCERVEVAGSVRRRRPTVRDIDVVLIPRDKEAVDSVLMQLGKVKMSGAKIARVTVDLTHVIRKSESLIQLTADTVDIDIYFATPETWATLFLVRTGSTENNIRLCSLAKKRGWKLAANGDGLFNEYDERIAGDSEESIYEALGIPWQEPWERG